MEQPVEQPMRMQPRVEQLAGRGRTHHDDRAPPAVLPLLLHRLARQTLALFLDPDRGVLPRQAEIDPDALGQAIALMGEAGTLKPSPPIRESL